MNDHVRSDEERMKSIVGSPVVSPRPNRHRIPRLLRRRATLPLAMLVVIVLVVLARVVANRIGTNDTESGGLVFVIPAGASETVDIPTIDSAIEIPVRINFAARETARIVVRNDDSVANRAGPWVVGAGQTYTLAFDQPGVYQFDCSVDAAESVVVTVESPS